MADVKYSTVTAPGNGVKLNWDFNFAGAAGTPGYLSQDHVKAFITNAAGGVTQVPILPAMWIGPTTIRVTPAVPTGSTLTIYRDTPKDRPLVDFETTAILSEASLDRSSRQTVYAVAEMVDAFADTKAAVDGVAGNVAAAAASAVASQASAVSSAASAALSQQQVVLATQQATNAGLQAQSALDSAAASFNSAGAAQGHATAASASAAAAAATYLGFDKRYLGAKATAPTVDNQGAALAAGAVYYNTTTPQWFVYDATLGWQVPTNNVLRTGTGVPGAGVGFNGDTYYDYINYMVYGPKAAGSWGAGTSLIGPAGNGTGNVLGPALSVDSEVAIFDGSTGTKLKRSALTASVLKIASGILTAAVGAVDYVLPGLITSANGITMNTGKLLGRTTAAAGGVQEITPGLGLTFASGTLSVIPAGSTLLATLTPTAGSAALNALTVFNSGYDNYLVVIDGLIPQAADTLGVRAAVAGATVSANYYASTSAGTGLSAGFAGQNIDPTGKGASMQVSFLNANQSNGLRVIHAIGMQHTAVSTPRFDPIDAVVALNFTGVLTGLSLYWIFGGTFAAVGSVRIYGLSNA